MRKIILLMAIINVLISSNQDTLAQKQKTKESYHAWWHDQYMWRWPDTSVIAKKMPLIQVKGNKFINSDGDTILFRGLAISDPDKLKNQGHWNKEYFNKIKEMGATIIRIPIHPVAWRERTPENYIKLLDQAVEWCTELEMYIIIDWHSIGNLQMELFQNPMYNTTKKETYEFWRTIASNYSGKNTIAFYEIFNEPTDFRGLLGRMEWSEWRKINEDIIQLIRAYDKETIPLVAGFDWAYDLSQIQYNPINAEGIGYVTHPYAIKRSQPWPDKWEEDFGFASAMYPIVATEFGFRLEDDKEVTDEHYAKIIIDYLESRGISWLGWVFDPEWGPSMLKSWDNYELTGCGYYFKKILNSKNRQKNSD